MSVTCFFAVQTVSPCWLVSKYSDMLFKFLLFLFCEECNKKLNDWQACNLTYILTCALVGFVYMQNKGIEEEHKKKITYSGLRPMAIKRKRGKTND